MHRLVLFSNPLPEVMAKLVHVIFPPEFKKRVFGYMPAEGGKSDNWLEHWRTFCSLHDAEFVYLDNTDAGDLSKLNNVNVLFITGGNTFQLAKNIRASGFDLAIKEYIMDNEKVLAGFSAGAIIMTPSIRVAGESAWGADENTAGVTNLTGLSLVDFEVLPHYQDSFAQSADEYEKRNNVYLKRIKDTEYLVLDI